VISVLDIPIFRRYGVGGGLKMQRRGRIKESKKKRERRRTAKNQEKLKAATTTGDREARACAYK
jgi:hypothetical protein